MHKRSAGFAASVSRRRLLAGGLSLAGALPLRAEALPAESGWVAEMEDHRATLGIPALGLGLAQRNQLAQHWVTGRRSADAPAPASPADRWHLGSLTKAMTATLAAILVEQGLIDWESELGALLGPEGQAGYQRVTLLQLLSHRSGLPANIPLARLDAYRRQDGGDPRVERLAFAREALALPPLAAPGATMVYSNLGYVAAAIMLEMVTGAPWEALIRQRLFGPLGLASAGFGPPAGPHPRGHLIAADGTRIPQMIDNPVAMGPAGRVHMALDDLLRFLGAHAERPTWLLPRRAWKMLHTPHFGGDYALGWIRLPDGRLWHNGSNGLWYAEALVDRSKGRAGALVANDAALVSGQPGGLILRVTGS